MDAAAGSSAAGFVSMADASLTYLPAALLAILSVVLLILYLWNRSRLKRGRDLAEAEERRYAEDRAHNQIQLTSAAADRAQREGVDVSRVRELLREAEDRVKGRDFDRALGLARAAQQHLGLMREKSRPLADMHPSPDGQTPGSSEVGSPLPPTRYMAAAARALPEEPTNDVEEPVRPAPISKIPKNRLEAQFMLRLLEEEIEKARRTSPPKPEVDGAAEVKRQAEAAFGKTDYTEALRLSLKGRRQLGARLETLPLTKSSIPQGPAATGISEVEGGEKCPTCGRPNGPEDRFCRGCGTVLKGAKCPRCGATVTPQDQFCGSCGAPIT